MKLIPNISITQSSWLRAKEEFARGKQKERNDAEMKHVCTVTST
jgi:hypothetical protein